jgi:hypothetical protein
MFTRRLIRFHLELSLDELFRRIDINDMCRNFLIGIIVIKLANQLRKRRRNPGYFRIMGLRNRISGSIAPASGSVQSLPGQALWHV